jgi:hypothetical protein
VRSVILISGFRFGLISETKFVPVTVMIETVEYDGMMSVYIIAY